MNSYPVIDIDAHVWEPKDLPLEPAFDQYRQKLIEFEDGKKRWVFDGQTWPKEGYACTFPGLKPKYRCAGEADPFNVEARLADMDQEGIDVALLFPTGSLSRARHAFPALGMSLARSYNNWLAKFCSRAPERLLGAGLIPLTDIQGSEDELRRCINDFGMRAICVPTNIYGKHLGDISFHPFYAEAERLGVPIMVHSNVGGYIAAAGSERFDNFFFTHLVSFPFEEMISIAAVIGYGIVERFPKLNFVFLEAGVGWFPYWLERMDEHYEKLPNHVPGIKKKPSEYLSNCFISCGNPDEKTLPLVIEDIGADHIVYASDYPHWSSVGPGTVNTIKNSRALSEEAKQKILSDNARKLLRLE
ncbi:MAG TPA: amidohydrolase family protein [Candidatus Binatia bacterium]